MNPNGIVINHEGKKADNLVFPNGDFKAAFEGWKPGDPSPFAQPPAAKETARP